MSTSIAELLASTIRDQLYRTAVSEWLPKAERRKEVKGKRGWEKTEAVNASSHSGGWVASKLVALLRKKDSKVGFFFFLSWNVMSDYGRVCIDGLCA